jgi:hypothetical protein
MEGVTEIKRCCRRVVTGILVLLGERQCRVCILHRGWLDIKALSRLDASEKMGQEMWGTVPGIQEVFNAMECPASDKCLKLASLYKHEELLAVFGLILSKEPFEKNVGV